MTEGPVKRGTRLVEESGMPEMPQPEEGHEGVPVEHLGLGASLLALGGGIVFPTPLLIGQLLMWGGTAGLYASIVKMATSAAPRREAIRSTAAGVLSLLAPAAFFAAGQPFVAGVTSATPGLAGVLLLFGAVYIVRDSSRATEARYHQFNRTLDPEYDPS